MKRSVKSARNVGKGCGIAFFGVFAAAGIAMAFFFGTFIWKDIRARFWEATPCTILSSELKEPPRGSSVLELSYLYTIRGQDYTGTQLKVSGNNFDDFAAAQRAARRYRSDQRSTCYVNPASPSESVLEVGNPWMALIILFPLVFVALGLTGMIALWRAKSPLMKSGTGRYAPATGAGVLRVMGIFFAMMGGVFVYLMSIRPWLQAREAASWTEVPCVVTESRVQSHSGSEGGNTYSIRINYKYTVAGEEHIGTRYNFETGSSSSRDWRERVVKAYPRGRKTICYVNPADPLDSVLSREMSSDVWFGLIGALFFVIGIGLFIGGGAASKRAELKKRATQPTGAAIGDLRGSIGDTGAPDQDSPLVLKPASSPLAGFILLSVIALFWNGVVWGILLGADIGGAGKLFLSLFALVGLGLLLGAVHQFLALFNPRPILQANANAARLGESLEVRFSFTGRVQRITRLKIKLKAEEVATYRRGTDTRTDRHTFHETPLLDTQDRALMPSGSVKLTIPTDSMHTFDASNNKIVWKLELHGEIPRWPDVKLEFPITVLPHRTATP